MEVLLAGDGPRLTAEERAVLDRALYRTYAGAGITADPATHARPAPLLRDLVRRRWRRRRASPGAGLGARLRRYVTGSLAGLFAGPTNVALDRPLVVFDVQGLEPELRPAGDPPHHRRSSGTWCGAPAGPACWWSTRPGACCSTPRAGPSWPAWPAGRASTTWAWSPSPRTWPTSCAREPGRSSLRNGGHQAAAEAGPHGHRRRSRRSSGLSAEERRLLLAAGKGEGLLLRRAAARVPLQVEASPAEHRLATTAPREVAALEALEALERTAAAPPPLPAGPAGATPHTGAHPGAPGPDGRRRRLGPLPEERTGGGEA